MTPTEIDAIRAQLKTWQTKQRNGGRRGGQCLLSLKEQMAALRQCERLLELLDGRENSSARWYGPRWSRLKKLLLEEGTEEIHERACAIMANGTAEVGEMPERYFSASEIESLRRELAEAREKASNFYHGLLRICIEESIVSGERPSGEMLANLEGSGVLNCIEGAVRATANGIKRKILALDNSLKPQPNQTSNT